MAIQKSARSAKNALPSIISIPVENKRSNCHLVPIDRIMYIESRKGHTCLVMAKLKDNGRYCSSVYVKDIGYFEEMLGAMGMFVRIHRSCIVNLLFVITLNKEDCTLTMENNKCFPISRSYINTFREMLVC